MRHLFAIAAGAFLLQIPAHADPRNDAERIVELTMGEDIFAATGDLMAELMVGSIQNAVRQEGGSLSDAAATNLVELLMNEMLPVLEKGMNERSVDIYLDTLSPDTLAVYRAFLETPAGLEVIEQTGTIMKESEKLGGEIANENIQTILKAVEARIEADDWPEGTLPSSKKEIRAIFED
ncbi:DUF2059 domain-containing protein [Henriciella litoralis]|uniref:DUF2059 domain-containing protein n=1 Tax=Henriciella litoralis TaxID=568102 RepID=UPI000A01F57D|nr:DUF2059 domain-containing protein [Henriciella litoralis]